MGMLANHISHIDAVRNTIKPVLDHFSKQALSRDIEQGLALAADLSFSDELLLEKFQMWVEERDDETFMFHIERFFEKRKLLPLTDEQRDLTSQRRQIESALKENVRNQTKQIFSQRITKLATDRNLLTNEQLGDFLEVSGEQARKFKVGEHKPQLATLKKIADRFNVSIEYLIGLTGEA